MSIFVDSAAAAVARALKTAGVWVAWGNGDPDWDTTPVAEPSNATALVSELGRRQASTIDYVVPDVGGTIVVPQGTFSVSSTPTDTVYVRCNFSNSEEVGESIREAAVFVGTTLQSGLPPGQDYFPPADVLSHGTMLLLERFAKIDRTIDFSVSLEFVMSL